MTGLDDHDATDPSDDSPADEQATLAAFIDGQDSATDAERIDRLERDVEALQDSDETLSDAIKANAENIADVLDMVSSDGEPTHTPPDHTTVRGIE